MIHTHINHPNEITVDHAGRRRQALRARHSRAQPDGAHSRRQRRGRDHGPARQAAGVRQRAPVLRLRARHGEGGRGAAHHGGHRGRHRKADPRAWSAGSTCRPSWWTRPAAASARCTPTSTTTPRPGSASTSRRWSTRASYFCYFDPIHLLPAAGQARWANPEEHDRIIEEAAGRRAGQGVSASGAGIDRGWRQLEAGNVTAARRTAESELGHDPAAPDALVLLAACHREQGEFEAALAALRRAGEAAPGMERARVGHGRDPGPGAGATGGGAGACRRRARSRRGRGRVPRRPGAQGRAGDRPRQDQGGPGDAVRAAAGRRGHAARRTVASTWPTSSSRRSGWRRRSSVSGCWPRRTPRTPRRGTGSACARRTAGDETAKREAWLRTLALDEAPLAESAPRARPTWPRWRSRPSASCPRRRGG